MIMKKYKITYSYQKNTYDIEIKSNGMPLKDSEEALRPCMLDALNTHRSGIPQTKVVVVNIVEIA